MPQKCIFNRNVSVLKFLIIYGDGVHLLTIFYTRLMTPGLSVLNLVQTARESYFLQSSMNIEQDLPQMPKQLFRAHPWHGIASGDESPRIVTVYIEIVPNDTMKFELDERSGFLRIDRPQVYPLMCPMPNGFIPRTFCEESVAQFSVATTGLTNPLGDGGPLDVCVLMERPPTAGDFLLHAKPIGGLRMIDDVNTDDKIIAVLLKDALFGHLNDINECSPKLMGRLEHYFLNDMQPQTKKTRTVRIPTVFGRDESHEVITRSQNDYEARFNGHS